MAALALYKNRCDCNVMSGVTCIKFAHPPPSPYFRLLRWLRRMHMRSRTCDLHNRTNRELHRALLKNYIKPISPSNSLKFAPLTKHTYNSIHGIVRQQKTVVVILIMISFHPLLNIFPCARGRKGLDNACN